MLKPQEKGRGRADKTGRLCATTWLLGVLDLVITLCLAQRFGAGIEANALMRPLFHLPILLAAFKIVGVGGLLYLLWRLRTLKIARFGVALCFGAYALLTAYHLSFLACMACYL